MVIIKFDVSNRFRDRLEQHSRKLENIVKHNNKNLFIT